jgi:serine/threonine protein kinase
MPDCLGLEKDGKQCTKKNLHNQQSQYCKRHQILHDLEQYVTKELIRTPLPYSFVHDFVLVRNIDHNRLCPRLFLMILKKTNEMFVLKKMRSKARSSNHFRPLVIEEINLALKLQSFPNPYINAVLGVIHHYGDWYLMMEYCDAQTLVEWRKNQANLLGEYQISNTEKWRKYYDECAYFFYLLCLVIHDCHEGIHIVHRDIKLENVLLQSYEKAPYGYLLKLTDFELSVDFHNNPSLVYENSIFGTEYMYAPEFDDRQFNSNIILNHTVDYRKVDVWCLGMCLYEFCFPHLSICVVQHRFGYYTQKRKTLEEICDPISQLPPSFLSLLQRMLCLNPNERASVTEILAMVRRE